MRRFTLLAAVLVAMVSTTLANAQSEDERIQMAVETRQGLLKVVGYYMGPLVGMAREMIPYDADLMRANRREDQPAHANDPGCVPHRYPGPRRCKQKRATASGTTGTISLPRPRQFPNALPLWRQQLPKDRGPLCRRSAPWAVPARPATTTIVSRNSLQQRVQRSRSLVWGPAHAGLPLAAGVLPDRLVDYCGGRLRLDRDPTFCWAIPAWD